MYIAILPSAAGSLPASSPVREGECWVERGGVSRGHGCRACDHLQRSHSLNWMVAADAGFRRFARLFQSEEVKYGPYRS